MSVQFNTAQSIAQQHQLPPPPDPQIDPAAYEQWLQGNASYIPEPAYHPQFGEMFAANDSQTGPAGVSFSDQVAGQEPQETDLLLALMSNESYQLPGDLRDPAQPPSAAELQGREELAAAGWTRLEPQGNQLVGANGETYDIDPSALENSSSGLRAAVYRNEQGQVTIAFAGTDPEQGGDIVADGGQGFGLETVQYEEARALAHIAEDVFGDGNVVFTGHSLGGGVASYAALATDSSAVTFNAAGLSDGSLRRLGLDPGDARAFAADNGQVRRYVVEGDPLNTAQQDVPFLHGIPNSIGYELRLDVPDGARWGLDSHSVYVDALRNEIPRAAEENWLTGAYDLFEQANEVLFNDVAEGAQAIEAIVKFGIAVGENVNTAITVGTAVAEEVIDDAVAVGEATVAVGQAVVEKVVDDAVTVGTAAVTVGKAAVEKVVDDVVTLGRAAVTVGKAAVEKVVDDVVTLGRAAVTVGKAVVDTAVDTVVDTVSGWMPWNWGR